jgi:hypothetical protein
MKLSTSFLKNILVGTTAAPLTSNKKRFYKSTIARLLILLFGLGIGQASWGQTLLAGWTFDSTSAVPNTPVINAANLGLYAASANIYLN